MPNTFLEGSPLDVARAFGVMAGPSALFDLFLAGTMVVTARAAP